MIIKFKLFEFFNELDPFGEENWDKRYSMDDYWEIVKGIKYLVHIEDEFDWIFFSFNIKMKII